MRIVRFQWQGRVDWGILEDDTIFSLLGDLYGDFSRGKQLCRLSDVRLLAPAEPSIMVACGYNYMGEIRKLGMPVPEEPTVFFKPAGTMVHPEGDVVYPPISQNLQHEGELCCVMKREAKNVPAENALDYVLGYTCGNDLGLADLFKKDGRLTRAKGFDTASPLGPCLAMGIDPHNLSIRARINGQTIQDSNTSQMVFGPEKIISHISAFMTLHPGDVVFTGTPEGGHYPVKVGDVMEVEIEGIGLLRNKVVAAH
ncbi:MAG: fumarylacetoacetate hydrolase family protein [Chloroflexi bacterium]|nr:fumarylacetoacetate hydrolase family protein [Chloroflexota bacterium]